MTNGAINVTVQASFTKNPTIKDVKDWIAQTEAAGVSETAPFLTREFGATKFTAPSAVQASSPVKELR